MPTNLQITKTFNKIFLCFETKHKTQTQICLCFLGNQTQKSKLKSQINEQNPISKTTNCHTTLDPTIHTTFNSKSKTTKPTTKSSSVHRFERERPICNIFSLLFLFFVANFLPLQHHWHRHWKGDPSAMKSIKDELTQSSGYQLRFNPNDLAINTQHCLFKSQRPLHLATTTIQLSNSTTIHLSLKSQKLIDGTWA